MQRKFFFFFTLLQLFNSPSINILCIGLTSVLQSERSVQVEVLLINQTGWITDMGQNTMFLSYYKAGSVSNPLPTGQQCCSQGPITKQ